MPRWLTKTGVWLLGAVAVLVLAAWLVLAIPMFSDFRKSMVESVLSDQIGQALVVKDDVSIVLGPTSRIHVSGVEIPSEKIPDAALAELNVLEFDLDLVALLGGSIDLDNLTVDGLQVNMLTLEDGTTSWTSATRVETDPAPEAEEPEGVPPDEGSTDEGSMAEDGGGIIGFLGGKTASFTSIGWTIDNQLTGFSFIFDLTNLNLDQFEEGEGVSLVGRGTLNGLAFEIDGNYPRGAPFTTRAAFGSMTLGFDGQPIEPDAGGGFSGQFNLEAGQFGDLLEGIGLQRTLEGQGRLLADLTHQSDRLKVENLDISIALDKGQLVEVTGSVDDLVATTGFDVSLNGRFHPEGSPPARARGLKDLELTGIHAHVVSQADNLQFEELTITTNLFDQGLNNIGPISIGRIRRSPEGELAFEGIRLQAGPPDAPYVVATGNIGDILQLRDLAFEGKLAGSASLLLGDLGDDVAAAFGGVEAEFAIDDAAGHLSLSKLDATTVDTDLWSLAMRVVFSNMADLDGFEFDFDLDVPDSAGFLAALDLNEIDAGAMEVTASARGGGQKLAVTAGALVGESRLDAGLEMNVAGDEPTIRGGITSDLVNIRDLKNAAAYVVQLGSLEKRQPKVQPLVMPKPEPQPLVLPKPEPQPLVLPKTEGNEAYRFELADLLSDLKIVLDIKEIVGEQGVSSVSSDFTIQDGKAQLGPLEVAYGGGYFNVRAGMDLVETPDRLSISGATGGWDFGDILDSIGLGIEAHGTLQGKFDVAGNSRSIDAFVNSMSGSATISMSRGNISTSLLELAGLGIFRWLFSEERSQKFTDIVCVVAPVRIDPGKVSSSSIVVETEKVQLVATGAVDWRNDSIALRAEPRPVGRPLARSAWPFDVTGKLSEPEFKLDVGGSRPAWNERRGDMPTDRTPCTPDIRQLE
ncbi:MAG: AsmA family protein [bacterium]|nr:AsmA family protein [bacterium]